MSHEFESGLFVGQPAWHGLGKLLKQAPTTEEAIVAAGLDWKVELEELALKSDGRSVKHRAVVRDSDRSILGVVGPAWHPLQNKDAFGWFQPLIDSGECAIEAAGSLFEGRKIWVLAKIKGAETEIVKGDEVVHYALLAHAHDGSMSIRGGFTTTRVVCANTLAGALERGASNLFRVSHTTGAVASLDRLRSTMDLARKEFTATADQLRELARKPCSDTEFKRYARAVFAGLEKMDDEDAAKITVAKVVPLFEAGRGSDIPGVRGTMWGAFNAITEFTTHGRGKSDSSRVDSAWFGDSAKIANRALGLGLATLQAA